MADPKSMTKVSKGVERGHILCCCAVVFVCFMLTCLNLYMLSSTRAVLRHLDSRFDAHPRALGRQQVQQSPEEAAAAAAAMLLQQQSVQLQQPQQADGADDFILLAPSDLDNAWTTQTGRLLVPVGQPEEDDDGWKQMQVQLAEQSKAQQQHIENLHDKLNDQYRAREELHRDQQDLLREHHELAIQHQRQLAKKDRQLLKEKHRALHQGVKHKDQLRRVQSEIEDLKKVVEEVQSLDPSRTTEPVPTSVQAPAGNIAVDTVVTTLEQKNGGEPVVNKTETVMEMAVPASAPASAEAEKEPSNSLEHIFSAVFGPSPGAYFFPSYTVGADEAEAERSSRGKRDLTSDLKERRERRLAKLASRFGNRRRRHNQEDAAAPMMRIDDGQLVPLVETPVLRDDAQGARRRRLALHRG